MATDRPTESTLLLFAPAKLPAIGAYGNTYGERFDPYLTGKIFAPPA
jgi:hypothetical protein